MCHAEVKKSQGGHRAAGGGKQAGGLRTMGVTSLDSAIGKNQFINDFYWTYSNDSIAIASLFVIELGWWWVVGGMQEEFWR